MTDKDWLDRLPGMTDEELVEELADLAAWVDPYYRDLTVAVLNEASKRLVQRKTTDT